MRTFSSEKKEVFNKMGSFTAVYFDEQIEEASEEGDPQFSYLFAKINKEATREEIVSRIIKASYPTYDSEIAAIVNGGEDSTQHQACREAAKVLADNLILFRGH